MLLVGYDFPCSLHAFTTKHGKHQLIKALSVVGFSNKFEGHSSLLSTNAWMDRMWLSWYPMEHNQCSKSCPFYWATLERQSVVWASSLWQILQSRCRPFQLQVARNSPTGCTSAFPSSTRQYTSCQHQRDPSCCLGYKQVNPWLLRR